MLNPANLFNPLTCLCGVAATAFRGTDLAAAIRALFSNNEKGVWYDPSDFSTMFQESTGVTPVTAVGQPVGLLLDKSKGSAGAQLVTNGTFDADTTGWVVTAGTAAVIAGELAVTSNGTGGSAYQLVTVEIGKQYHFTAGMRTGTSTVRFRVGTSLNGLQYGNFTTGPCGLIFTATATTLYLTALNGNSTDGTVGYYDNISVKELPGNHAIQATSTSRPILARHPATGKRNLLTYSEDFSNVAWAVVNGTKTTGIADPLGGTTACTFTATGASATLTQTISGNYSAISAKSSIWMRRKTGTGVVSLFSGSAGTQVHTLLTGAWQRIDVIAGVGYSTYTMLRITLATSGDAVDIAFGQFEQGSVLTDYQKTTTIYDTTEAGVADLHYLKFDGVDDSLATAAIDFSATDKMSVFAGVRKLSDAATAMVVELSANAGLNINTFALQAPRVAAEHYSLYLRGNDAAVPSADRSYLDYITFTAPITNVITAQFDKLGVDAASQMIFRANSDAVSGSGGSNDLVDGNFGNYPLYIGRRGGSSFPFNGHLYSLIVRGALSDADQITAAETYVNSKTKAYT